ncbi:ArsR family transcriptional regulator [Streptomyces sp. Tu 6176]|uniref:ArsR/SmtB family transcription factor n=1 Tax=Streptomyces sp. Tu 6176 TaxID=1470557 RepID=UPI000451F9DF|nr:helix-turn-helix domain-containing protein [Streptomyces sp. Tu 6176]EYT81672.1 ArsR family transcriptional regulator [Streptomyces sp. Tu 6176]
MTDPSTTPPAQPSAPEIELDTAALRVLAHPVRIDVLGLLRRLGPSTATRLAAELRINPGAASYHLRRLAAGGLIEEEPGRGKGRERWWRACHHRSVHDPAAGSPEQREAGRAYTHAVALAAAERLRAAAAEVPLLPEPWTGVSAYGDFVLRLRPAELAALRDELFAVIARHGQPRTPLPAAAQAPAKAQPPTPVVADPAPVMVQVQAFPVPGAVALRDAGS